jgi:[amino group carrier protein]-lysine/ornithine hydrolase
MNSQTFLKDILKIPSVSGNEEEISNYLREFLKKNDFRILSSEIGNVSGIKGNGHPILLLASHMDTVPTENPYREEENKIYSTGAVDCKPALAAMFYAASQDSMLHQSGTLIISGIVQEENHTIGIEELFKTLEQEKITPDYAIFGEPTKNNRICIGYRGRIWLKINYSTAPSHSASSWESDNLIDVNYEIYNEIKQYSKDYNSKLEKSENFKYFNEISVNMTEIKAGSIGNSLPEKCYASIDIRIPTSISADILCQEIKKIIKKVQDKLINKNTEISFEFLSKFNACDINAQSPVLNSLRWAAFKEIGEKIILLKKTGSTFTNIIQEHYEKGNSKFSCITYGPGDPRLEHTNKEFIDILEYEKTIKIYIRFFPKFVEFYKKSIEM